MDAIISPSPASSLRAWGHRLLMTGALLPLSRERHPSARALARALRKTAFGQASAAERRWFERIEAARSALLAQFRAGDSRERDNALAVEWMSIPPILGRLIFQLTRELAPEAAIELGTGFGVSAAYIGAALELNGAGSLTTIDIEDVWTARAAKLTGSLRLERVRAVTSPPDEQGALIASQGPVGLAFVDSDHRTEETLRTLRELAPALAPGALVVFDDVGFSPPEMDGAWEEIEAHPQLGVTRRFGRLGAAIRA